MVLTKVTTDLQSIFDGARRVAVLTGAGISAESGVPTFRGGGGSEIWSWRGRPVTELSSAELIATDPKLVWEWFDYRRGLLGNLEPNPGHRALAEWEPRFDEFTLITQNIDDLHRVAGSLNVLELHGNIWRARCLRCASTFEARESPLEQNPPLCLGCGGPARPDVVLFGEMLPDGVFERAEEAAARLVPLTQDDQEDELLVLASKGRIRLGEGVIDNSFWELPAPDVAPEVLRLAIDHERNED